MEHIQDGRLTLEEYAVYTLIIQNANHKTGIWLGCAQVLARQTRKSERWCQRIIASLRKKGYISGKPSTGRGLYPVKVTKYFEGKASVVSPSVQEGVCGVTLSPQKASVVTPLEEVIQEVHQEPPLASLAAPVPEKLGFDSFWEVYPRKVGKFMARKAWNKIPGIEEHILDVVQSVEAWKQTEQWQDVQFVPHPATFLNGRRWEDEVPERAVSKNEQQLRRSFRESAELAKRIREGSAHFELDDVIGRPFQPRRKALIS